MHPAFRVGLVVLGVSMAVYGAASLTGGWLGKPPWWEQPAPLTPFEWMRRYKPRLVERGFVTSGTREAIYRAHLAHNQRVYQDVAARHVEPREGREWISGGVASAGLALVAVGAWPRRRRVAAP